MNEQQKSGSPHHNDDSEIRFTQSSIAKPRFPDTESAIRINILREGVLQVMSLLDDAAAIEEQPFETEPTLFDVLPDRWYSLPFLAEQVGEEYLASHSLKLIKFYAKIRAKATNFNKNTPSENFKCAIARHQYHVNEILNLLKDIGVIDEAEIVQPFFQNEGYAIIANSGKLEDTTLTAFGELFFRGVEILAKSLAEIDRSKQWQFKRQKYIDELHNI